MRRSVSRPVLATAALSLLLWALVLSALWKPGWCALGWDDFMRVEIAQRWAEQPFLATGQLVWLPLQWWIYGIGFVVTGDWFADNPMLLAALINTVAAAGAAVLVGSTAWRLFRSAVGGLLAFVAVLFAPWVVFTSLSGLSEPLYYLAVATVIWALAARQSGGGVGTVALGSLGVGAAAAVRYEGWLLAPAWLAIVVVTLLPSEWVRPPCLGRALWRGRTVLAVATAPFLVPAGWMVMHAVRRGNALSFIDTTAALFEASGTGVLFANVVDRLAYYPRGLLTSAPVLFPLLVVLALVGVRHASQTRLCTALVTLHFGLLCLTSLHSGVGLFTERFMFAFVLALAPLLGMVPSLLMRVRPWRARAALIALLLALLLAEAISGLARPLDEWRPPPDLLETSALLGELARMRSTPLRVFYGAGMKEDRLVLQVPNGRRIIVVPSPPDGAQPPSAGDVWIERLPARIRALAHQPNAIVGRYHLYGPIPTLRDDQALGEWRGVDEDGVAMTLRPFRCVGLEFTSDNPPPGAAAFVERIVPRRDRSQHGSLAVRWTYGHGFNLGRITVEVRLDGRVIFRTDVGMPNRWRTVDFEIPGGLGNSAVTVAIGASDRIDSTWSWGRSSTVIVKDFVLFPE